MGSPLESGRIRIARILVVASLIVIGALTLYPVSNTGTSGWYCILCGARATADMILNIILFAPLGVALALLRIPFKKVLLVALLISGLVESAQVLIPGRDASIGDLISNTAGCGLGIAVVSSARLWLTPTATRAGWLSLGASIVAATLLTLTGIMLQPSFTESAYYGQWTPRLGNMERYEGRVLSAEVGSHHLPSGRLDNTDTVLALLREGNPIRVTAEAGPEPSRLAPLFNIADADQHMIVEIGIEGSDLVFSQRVRATSFRLDRPTLQIPGALTVSVGDTISIKTWPAETGRCLVVNLDRACGLGYTVGFGWALLMYSHTFPIWLQQVLSILWISIVVAPFGFWLRRSAQSIFGAIILCAGLLLAPGATGLLATPIAEWTAAGIGLTCGIISRSVIGKLKT